MSDITHCEENFLPAYLATRRATLALCKTLEIEDYGLQAMPGVSPPKWHLAHTSWFFETFILKPFATNYRSFHPRYEYLFNSYYHAIGEQYPRSQRGLLSRPTVKEVLAYRQHVDTAMADLLTRLDHPKRDTMLQRCELGLHHEQQHQELLCTDIKYSFSFNPLYPALAAAPLTTPLTSQNNHYLPLGFLKFEAQDAFIGYSGEGFHFDNEVPTHRYHLPAFSFANRLTSNAEYLAFMRDDGYKRPELWLADGWIWKQENQATQPRYWIQQDDAWHEYTLYGLLPIDLTLPVSHVNYYEADAYARWSGKRLPREQEWETVCQLHKQKPDKPSVILHPRAAESFTPDGSDNFPADSIKQLFGSLWQWTQSSYAPYPGYQPVSGAIGEYNGKFMCNQLVLRGSSCVTPIGHARISYRNFFYPDDQWQFTGIRLADDI